MERERGNAPTNAQTPGGLGRAEGRYRVGEPAAPATDFLLLFTEPRTEPPASLPSALDNLIPNPLQRQEPSRIRTRTPEARLSRAPPAVTLTKANTNRDDCTSINGSAVVENGLYDWFEQGESTANIFYRE